MALLECVHLIDKNGDPFELGEYRANLAPSLKLMYDGFARLAISQGLPPVDSRIRALWIDRLLETGINFLARAQGRIVGHASLIADIERKDGEYVIFVAEDFRNRGLGTQLTLRAVQKARHLGLKTVWLTVESYNFRAIRVYRNSGFCLIEPPGEKERSMALEL